jgi:hypothetical protein
MRAPTAQEKRTLRLAAFGISIYLVLFFGFMGFKKLETRRVQYKELQAKAQRLKFEIAPYQDKAAATRKLMETYQMDPSRLVRSNLVSEASAAIQKAATGNGIQLGPIRETLSRTAGKELSVIQLEASGPPAAILNLLGRFDSLGFPLVIDTAQINADPKKPGMIKLGVTILLLDFDQWKKEAPHA